MPRTTQNHYSPDRPNFARKTGKICGFVSFYGTLAVAALSAIPFGTVDPWLIQLVSSAMCFFGAMRIADAFLTGEFTVSEAKLLLPLALLLIFGFVQTVSFFPVEKAFGEISLNSGALSLDKAETRLFTLRFLACLTALELLFYYANSLRRLKIIGGTIVLIGGASALFAVFRFSLSFDLPRLPHGVGFGQFINRNHFAFLAEMLLGLVIGLAFAAKRNSFGKLCAILSIPLLISILIVSESRGALIAVIAVGICAFLIFPREKESFSARERFGGGRNFLQKILRRRAPLSVALICVFLISFVLTVALVGGDAVVSRIEKTYGEIQNDRQTSVSRRDFWLSTVELIKSRPLAGSGFAAFSAAITPFDRSTGRLLLQQAHNDYLEFAAGGGLLGAILFLWFGGVFCAAAARALKAPHDARRYLAFGACLGIAAAMVHSFFDFGLHTTVNAYVFILLLVLAAKNPYPQNFSGEHTDNQRASILKRAAFAVLFLILICGGAQSLKSALSLYFSDQTLLRQNDFFAAKALEIDGGNYEAFQNRAQIAFLKNDFETAQRDYIQAINLRPADYLLWLQLAAAYRQSGSLDKAEFAAQNAARLAPNYSQSYWILGEIYLRAARKKDAFINLNRAANIDVLLYPHLLQFANFTYFNDPAFDDAVTPETRAARMVVAEFCIAQNIASEKVERFVTGDEVSDAEKDALIEKLVKRFNFELAGRVWKSKAARRLLVQPSENLLADGDFETEIAGAEKTFGWRFDERAADNIRVVRSGAEAAGGNHSLAAVFEGKLPSGKPFAAQLAQAAPQTRYKLDFAAKIGKDFVSASSTKISITDAVTKKPLGEPLVFNTTGGDWKKFSLEFSTAAETRALILEIAQTDCPMQPCPAFGTIFFDDFSLVKFGSQCRKTSAATERKKFKLTFN